MTTNLTRRPTSSSLLTRLIEAPDLVRRLRRLPAQTFSALVHRIGVEDAGEIIALATTDQIVAAFDEDLFVNDTPGERETFDAHRFIVWLEVLLEAGSDVVAQRVAELSEDFVAHALSSIILVLDYEALMASRFRLGVGSSGRPTGSLRFRRRDTRPLLPTRTTTSLVHVSLLISFVLPQTGVQKNRNQHIVFPWGAAGETLRALCHI
ncbi:MAG: hypothetical protein J7M25_11720 [Deltaproteobacteria bacterium]|nr:hypothetical protein [Deltaproteobacteria bacterium]